VKMDSRLSNYVESFARVKCWQCLRHRPASLHLVVRIHLKLMWGLEVKHGETSTPRICILCPFRAWTDDAESNRISNSYEGVTCLQLSLAEPAQGTSHLIEHHLGVSPSEASLRSVRPGCCILPAPASVPANTHLLDRR